MQASSPTTPPPTISQWVRIFKGRTSRALGKAIFQRSFYDHIVRNDEEYWAIWAYIRQNPQTWLGAGSHTKEVLQ